MLSLVIPTYNERDALNTLLPSLAGLRPRFPEALEVLIVDDQSTDGTPDIAEQFLRREALGRVIRRAGPRDLAQAVVEGIRHARGDLIGVMDADLSHPPELLPLLVEAVRSGSDVAIASRYVPGGGIRNWPWRRRTLSWIGNVMARPLVRVADATSGYFVCRTPLVKSLGLQPRGFKILLEILVRGGVQRVQELPYVFTDRVYGSSKLAARTMWCYLIQLIQLYRFQFRHPRASTPLSTPQKAHA